eukprot:6152797-Ditylum_brightwellii.AAC.1
MRNNAHLVHKKYFGKKALSQKDFTMEWVRPMTKLVHLYYSNTRNNQSSIQSSQLSAPKKDSKHRGATNFQALLDAYPEKKAHRTSSAFKEKPEIKWLLCDVFCPVS